MSDGDEPYRRALRALADSARNAAGEPPRSGAEVRALAERRRRRRRALGVPAVTVSGLLVGGTAFALGGAFHAAPRPAAPSAVSVSPSASATPAIPHASASGPPAATGGAGAAAGTPGGAAVTTGPTASSRVMPSGTGAAAWCASVRAGETLESLRALTVPDGLTSSGIGTVVFAVPLSCVQGHLLSSGAGEWIPVAPGAVVTTTAPLSTGSTSSPSTLQKLAAGLARHPDQVFGVRRESTGQVVRMDQVYQS
ncbi:hypothetical protein NGB36_02275 [Streptomyces sp. RB6PN25]|uniref:Uncharacterized protein n=1 Tax=Streptomyces humicola TaxID=2953240 RepID=A0ABT1PP63_9ACTN|nr:hypothetical protein [Streptomyces humicola]MCQ4079455.1 hypothetical protein [Streptomyces humicola]